MDTVSDNKACFEKDSWPESKKPYFATGTGPLDEWASSYMAVPRTQFASAVGVMLSLAHLLCETEKKFRVTIECDPKTGRVEAKREDLI